MSLELLTAAFQAAIILCVIIMALVVAGSYGMGGIEKEEDDDWGGPK